MHISGTLEILALRANRDNRFICRLSKFEFYFENLRGKYKDNFFQFHSRYLCVINRTNVRHFQYFEGSAEIRIFLKGVSNIAQNGRTSWKHKNRARNPRKFQGNKILNSPGYALLPRIQSFHATCENNNAEPTQNAVLVSTPLRRVQKNAKTKNHSRQITQKGRTPRRTK